MSTDDSGGWAQQWWRRASQRFSQGSSSLDRRRTVAGVEFTTRWTTGYEYLESVTDFFSTCLDKMNAWGERSWIGRFFTFRERQARLGKELHAGLISFLMVVYTLTVNPQILSTTGGTCDAATLCEPEVRAMASSVLSVPVSLFPSLCSRPALSHVFTGFGLACPFLSCIDCSNKTVWECRAIRRPSTVF